MTTALLPENEAATAPEKTVTESENPKNNKFASVCAVLASMNLVLLGYDIGVMSGAIIYIKRDLNISDEQIEILVGILNIYSLVGSVVAGRTSDWIGRRYTMVLAGGIFFVGALLMGFATNYTFLMFGRFVAGVGIGFSSMIASVYIAEISPASSRGFLTSFPEVSADGGILLGYVSNYAFSKFPLYLGWRLMLGIGAVPALFFSLAVLAMPESPRWLVMQGRLKDAEHALEKTSNSHSEVALRLAEIKLAVGIPVDCNDDIVMVPKKNSHGNGVWKELILRPTPAVRRVLVATLGIHFFQQASGTDAVVLYSPRIFKAAGLKSDHQQLLATVAVGSVKTLFLLVPTFLLDRIGRRPLLLNSVGGMVLSLLILGTSLTVIDHSVDEKVTWAVVLCVTTVMTFMATLSIGIGPITWIYSSEVFPLRLRAQGISMALIVNRVTSGVISMTFLSLTKAITTGGAFFMFGGIAAVGWVFVYSFLPETKGKILEEMDELFENFK